MVGTILIRAKIKVFTEAEGGKRKTPIYSGYRPNHIFEYFSDGVMRAYSGQIEFIDRESLSPGEECEAFVKFLKVEPIVNYLEVGRTWFFNEAQHPIGKGVILEILN